MTSNRCNGNNLAAGRKQGARRWRRSSPLLLAVPALGALAIAVASAGLLVVDLMSGRRGRRRDGVLRGGDGAAFDGVAGAVWEESRRHFDWTRLSTAGAHRAAAAAAHAPVVVAHRGDVDYNDDGKIQAREALGKGVLLRLLASTDYCSAGRPPLHPSSREFTILTLTLGPGGGGDGDGERAETETKTTPMMGRWIEGAFPGARVRSISLDADELRGGGNNLNLGGSSPLCRTLAERERRVDVVLVEAVSLAEGVDSGRSGSTRDEDVLESLLSSPSLVPGDPAHLLATTTFHGDGVGVDSKSDGDTATASTSTAIERAALGGKWAVLRAAHPPPGDDRVRDGAGGGSAETRKGSGGAEEASTAAQVAAVLYVSRVLGEELTSLSTNKGLDHTCQVAWEYERSRERGGSRNDEGSMHGVEGGEIENGEGPTTSFFGGLCA